MHLHLQLLVGSFFFILLSRALSSKETVAGLVDRAAEDEITTQLKQQQSCCKALDRLLPGKVDFPISLNYISSQQSYYTMQEGEITPTCIVTPTSSKDVAVGLLTLNAGDRLKLQDCDFAVRSGGHTPWGGAANVEDGVTFDLKKLNQVDISSDRKLVSIGPGNRWGDIYPKLDNAKLAMVGGRDSGVGSGGLVIGGGISFFSGRQGFSCDNIENFEVVLANGKIVNANETANQDLYRALKGGSNNFGIVTRMDAHIFEQGDIWGGFVIQPITEKEQQFAFVENFTKSENFDEYAALINSYSFASPATDWIIANHIVYTKPEPYPPVFKGITDQPQVVNTFKTAPLSTMTNELQAAGLIKEQLGRMYFATLTFKNSAAYMKAFFELADEWKKSIVTVLGARGAVSFQPVPTIITRKGALREGGNVLGLDDAPDLQNALIGIAWTLKADDARIDASLKDLFTKAEKKAKEMGVYHPYIYLNYAVKGQKPIAGYGEANVNFLNKVSKRVDPTGLFQRRCLGGFKLTD